MINFLNKYINESGQILVIVFVALGLVLFTVLSIIAGAQIYFSNSFYSVNAEKATALAEAGIDKALASLNKTGGSYSGEDETNLGDSSYSVKVTTKDTVTKIIESTGYIPNKTSPKVKRTIQIQTSRGIGASFVYGVQVGEGGLQLGNTNVVQGSIYSNGSIYAGNGNNITGDVYIAGGTQAVPDQSTDCVGVNCADYLFGKTVSGDKRLNVAQSFKISASGILNKVKFKLKKVGTPADATVRILKDISGIPDKNNVVTSGILSSSLVASSYGWIEATFGSAPLLVGGTTYWVMITTSSDNSNYFYWQNDLAQSYNNGLPKWSPDWSAGNPSWTPVTPGDFSFQIYMGGGQTKLTGNGNFTVGGSVHANTIENITISKDAYYQTLTNSTVSGTKYPNSDDPPPRPFPLSDANVTEWKKQAGNCDASLNNCQNVSTGISSCTNLVSKKYVGDVTFNSHCDITAGSPIWITGNFTINTNNTVKLEPSFGPISGVIIVDGIITLGSNNHVEGSGTGSSVLLLLSTYNSEADGVSAIKINNTGNVVVLYANKGIIEPGNSNQFKELTAWGIKLINNGTIVYDTGLSSSLFTSGPTGTFSLVKGTYQVK